MRSDFSSENTKNLSLVATIERKSTNASYKPVLYFQHAHFIPTVGVGKRGEY